MLVRCSFDSKKFSSKPVDTDIFGLWKDKTLLEDGIQQRLTPTLIDTKDLAQQPVQGCSYRSAEIKGTKDKDFVSQQLFSLDFDNGYTIQQFKQDCMKNNLYPNFVYLTFSHTERHHKFRAVFCLDETVFNKDIASIIQQRLISIFPESDKQCKNPSRIFFGGFSLVEDSLFNFENTISVQSIFSNEKGEDFIKFLLDWLNRPLPVVKTFSNTDKNKLNHSLSVSQNVFEEATTFQIVDAIKKRDLAFFRRIGIGNEKIIVENRAEFDQLLFSIDIADFLKISNPKKFSCIFKNDHKNGDLNPSANIFKNENGVYIYKCFSCWHKHNIQGLIETLADCKTITEGLRLCKHIFNIDIKETPWQVEQKEMLRENLRKIRTGEIQIKAPTTNKTLSPTTWQQLSALLNIAIDNVRSDTQMGENGELTFFASQSEIRKALGKENSNSEFVVAPRTAILAYHELIKKQKNDEVPKTLMDRAIREASVKQQQQIINFFTVPQFTDKNLEKVEQQAQKYKNNMYTTKSFNWETLYESEGKEVANSIYPRMEYLMDETGKLINRNLSSKTIDKIKNLEKFLLNEIEKKSYCVERDLINFDETTWRKTRKAILDKYSLERRRATKEIQYRLGIPYKKNSTPFIILKSNYV